MENSEFNPQTPGVLNASVDSPPLTPPQLQNHPSSQEFVSDNRALTAPHNSLLHHPNDAVEDVSSPILDFPVIRENTNSFEEGNSFESPPAPIASLRRNQWNINPAFMPARRGRRRRSTSFDGSLPVPRITLRPRFTSHLNYPSRYAIGSNPPLAFGQLHDPSDESCSCLECLIRAIPNSSSGSRGSGDTPPTSNRPTHFRSHTYNGSDASTNIFALAMQQEQFSETSAPTLPVVHTPLNLSSLTQNLPPATQAFVAPHEGAQENPLDRDLGRNLINRPIPRHHLNRDRKPSAQPSTSINTAGRQVFGGTSSQSPFLTSPSQGTATCTVSTSSASAFDQTTSLSPNWHQSPGNSSIVFEQLQKQERDKESLSTTEFDVDHDDDDSDIRSERESTSLPFDEVHFLVDHQDKKPDGSTKEP